MWKRLPHRERGGKENHVQISGPTLVESSYSQSQLDNARDLSGHNGQHDYRARPTASRQNTDNSVVPPLEFSRPPPRTSSYANNRPSVAASSIYSQPSPELDYTYSESMPPMPPGSSHQQYYDKISPPTSPGLPPADDNGGVSPVEESASSPSMIPSPRQGSHIPVPRKASAGLPAPTAKRAPPAKAWTQAVGKGSPMMWDKYSGEPTLTGAGVPAQVKPGSAFNLRSQLRPVGNKAYQPPPADPVAPQKATFREKAFKFRQGLTVDTRPSWKGASGRQAIVAAPEDKPGQPIPRPARTVQQVSSPVRSPQSVGSPSTAHRVALDPETARVATPENMEAQEDHVNAVEPHQTERSSPRQILASQASRDLKQTGYPSPVSPVDGVTTPIQESQQRRYPSLANNSGADIILPKRQPRSSTDKESPTTSSNQQGDLTSRFSWTTQATNTTYQQSPPPSPPPPMPALYANKSSPTPVSSHTVKVSPDTAPTVLNRGHPTRRLGDQAAGPPSPTFSMRSMSSTIRKPVPAQPIQTGPLPDWRDGISRMARQHRAPSVAPSTTSTTADKSLPKTPHQLASVDLITSLQAQLDDFFNQRSNLQRLIRDLEKTEAQNPLVSDFRTRREKEKRLGSLKEDLDEIARLEYEVGLRLHRAWKRREAEDPSSGPSVLWVRRVTGGL